MGNNTVCYDIEIQIGYSTTTMIELLSCILYASYKDWIFEDLFPPIVYSISKCIWHDPFVKSWVWVVLNSPVLTATSPRVCIVSVIQHHLTTQVPGNCTGTLQTMDLCSVPVHVCPGWHAQCGLGLHNGTNRHLFYMYTEPKYKQCCKVLVPCFMRWNKRSQKCSKRTKNIALRFCAKMCLHPC